MFQIVFYVPKDHLETVKSAVFDAGGGRYNDYDQCCWQIEGEGQFRPLKNSRPFIGEQGLLEKIKEFRVEMVVSDDLLQPAVAALLDAHPYEEPAYLVLKIENLSEK